jgi:23S rRNA pseudouridine2457 synthase
MICHFTEFQQGNDPHEAHIQKNATYRKGCLSLHSNYESLEHRHFILHKPFGYLCQFTCELDWKKLLGELHDFPEGTMAIGRLDEDSEGLLILTTSGMMSEKVRSRNVEKEYHVQVDGIITDEALEKLRQGVEIGIRNVKYVTQPCKAERLEHDPGFAPRTKKIRDDRHGPTCWISITITEGRYRQIRKMTAAAGFPTLRLVRVRIGNVCLGELKAGEKREMEEERLLQMIT